MLDETSKLLTRQKKWQLKFPERRQAHLLVASALRRGEIAKTACEDCGATGIRLDCHHERYDRPLEITVLCRRCHVRRHRRKIVGTKGAHETSRRREPVTGPQPLRAAARNKLSGAAS